MTSEDRKKIRKLERDIRIMQKENRRIFGEEKKSPIGGFIDRIKSKFSEKDKNSK